MKLVALGCVAALACAAAATNDQSRVVTVTNPLILSENQGQHIFENALAWSRKHRLETGGCFTVFYAGGRGVIITNVRESVVWRRAHDVQLDCAPADGTWHTHWTPESSTTVGCNVNRAQDLFLIGKNTPLGLVVCGVGRDSVIPYAYSPAADAENDSILEARPDLAAAVRSETAAQNKYTCADEDSVSLARPIINCRKR